MLIKTPMGGFGYLQYKFTFSGTGSRNCEPNEKDVMVNATEMARVFNKTPKDYLRTQSAKDLLNAVSGRQKCLPADLVKVINGGTDYGTWMHETIALDFAQWLSVDFKLWCNDRINELQEAVSGRQKCLPIQVGNK